MNDLEPMGLCGVDAFCVDGHCQRELPGEGERCSTSDVACRYGLDCQPTTSRCQRLHQYDEPCNEADDEACGRWLECVGGTCRHPGALGSNLGEACEERYECSTGWCFEGICQRLPDRGEACAQSCFSSPGGEPMQCLEHCQLGLTCVDGHCEAMPVCRQKQDGEPCESVAECAPGLHCNEHCTSPDANASARGSLTRP